MKEEEFRQTPSEEGQEAASPRSEEDRLRLELQACRRDFAELEQQVERELAELVAEVWGRGLRQPTAIGHLEDLRAEAARLEAVVEEERGRVEEILRQHQLTLAELGQEKERIAGLEERYRMLHEREQEVEAGLEIERQRRLEVEDRLGIERQHQRTELEERALRAEALLVEEQARNQRYVQQIATIEELTLALARSRRWRIGSAVVDSWNRLRRRKRTQDAFDRLSEIFASLQEPQRPAALPAGAPAQAKAPPRAPGAARVTPRPDAVPALPAADVVICIHDAPQDVEVCLESVIRNTNLVRNHVILVDDGSAEAATRQVLSSFVARVPCTMIRNEKPRGYTVAANQGIAASSRDYVVLLNSDTTVTPGWLSKLIHCAETMPGTAVVGPLSNAASWQSIPELAAPGEGWALNELPQGLGPDDLASFLDRWSPTLYPSTSLVNGFCYMISRVALDAVGPLDEESFPRGYGEEDDFSLRCLAAGFHLRIADDCYVYHSKSKSYTPEGRKAIVSRSKEALRAKHGSRNLKATIEDLQRNEELIRARTYASLVVRSAGRPAVEPAPETTGLRLGWVVPHLGEVGGIRRTIEMTNRLVRWGWTVDVITSESEAKRWLPVLAAVETSEGATRKEYDVLMVSDPDVTDVFSAIEASTRLVYHLAPYMMYRPRNRALRDFYAAHDAVHLANSRWTAEKVEEEVQIEVRGVFPGGVDKRLFHPKRRACTHDVVCYGSRRPHKGTSTIEEACSHLELLKLADRSPAQHELAWEISAGRVFASGCWHEGFNFLPLEAMACGVPVVTTDDGGSREYVVDGENAYVVDPKDPEAMRSRIDQLLEDRQVRARFIERGLQTAWEYDWDRVTADFAELVVEIHRG